MKKIMNVLCALTFTAIVTAGCGSNTTATGTPANGTNTAPSGTPAVTNGTNTAAPAAAAPKKYEINLATAGDTNMTDLQEKM